MKLTLSSLLLAAFAAAAVTASAETKPVKAPKGGKQISNQLIGIFFEDIDSSADGGLYAELLQNGSFEYNFNERDGWGPGTAWHIIRPGHSLGYATPMQISPLNANNPNYMRINTERVGRYYDYDGWTGFGLENNGFDGIVVKKDEFYDLSFFARNPDKKATQMRAVLVDNKDKKILADTTISVESNEWAKQQCALRSAADCNNASLRLLSLTVGTVDIDMLSLMPRNTYKGHGLRRDLAEALAALHPKFMRFPGGCIIHGGGDGMWNTYRWKNSVGPKEQRLQNKNTWGYHQSLGLGYYEYFQLCEDIGMEPLPILPCGVSCQGAGGGWPMKEQAQDAVPMSEMDEWTQDVLDLIEWANGDVSTKWGRIRAEAGHPAPFNLKYIGIGNEERITPEFAERFKYIYERVVKAHPEIIVVGTAGTASHPNVGYDYGRAWKLADELAFPIIDEHYYEPSTYFETSRQYDAYPRDRKTKVYVGEYASTGETMRDALAEALYLIHIERNADIVTMTSYAPLFGKGTKIWGPNLIHFTNTQCVFTCSYYVQQMFGRSSGNYFYGDCVKFQGGKTNLQEQSVVLNTATREVFIKICNASGEPRKADINLARFNGLKSNAIVTTLKGDPKQLNNYEQQPIATTETQFKLKKQMTVDLEPYSFIMITAKM